MPVGINSNSNRTIVKNITVGVPEKRVTGGWDINNLVGVDTTGKKHADILVYDSGSSKYVTATVSTGDGISFTWNDSDQIFQLTLDSAEFDSDVRELISVVDAGGDGSLAYNSGTGVITYTGPSASEVRAHFSAGQGIDATELTSGVVAIDSAKSVTVASVTTTGNVTVGGDLTVSGTTTTVNTETINLADNTITLNSNATGSPTENGGIEIERGDATNKTLIWNETTDKWTVGSETFVAGTFEGNVTGTVSSLSNHTTDDLAETATNLYLNATRVRDALNAGTNLSYDSSTGTYSLDSSQDVKVQTVTTSSDIIAGGNIEVGSNSFVGGELEVQQINAKDSNNIYVGDNVHVAGKIIADSGTFSILRTNAYRFPLLDAAVSGQAIVSDGNGTLSFSTISGGEGGGAAEMKDLADVDNSLRLKRYPDHFLLWDSSYVDHDSGGQYVPVVFGDEVHSRFASSSNLTYDSATGRFSITNTGVTAATYGSASQVPVLEINAQGQINSATTVSVAGVSSTSYDSATGIFTINTADGGSFATILHDSNNRISEIRNAISASGDLSYNASTGVFSFDVEQVYTKANFDSDFDLRISETDLVDSTDVSNIITADVDATFINALTIDADTLGGQNSAYHLNYNNFTNTPTIPTLYGDYVDSAQVSAIVSATDLVDSTDVSNIITADVDKAFVDALNINADQLDGQEGTYYLNYNNFTNTPAIPTLYGDFVDSAQVSAIISATDLVDSTDVSNIIIADVDATFINALTIDADTLGGTSASGFIKTTGQAQTITDTTAGSAAAPEFELMRDITGADGNYIGQIKFSADNDANGKKTFAKITGKIGDAAAGSEDGIIEIAHLKAGSQNINVRMTSTEFKIMNGTDFDIETHDGSSSGLRLNNTLVTSTAAELNLLDGKTGTVWTSDNDGAGSGLDADTLDGQQGAHYLDYNNFTNTPTLPTLYSDFVDSTEARKVVSVTDAGGDGSLSYNNGTGVFTYTGPSASEARAHFSGGTGVTITDGEIAIGQAVATTSDVTFADLTVSNLTVTGTTTEVNTIVYTTNDPLIHLADSNEESDVLDIGFIGHYFRDGQRRHTGFFRDASNQQYYLYHNLVDSAFDSAVPPNVVNRGGTDYTTSTINANVVGNVTGAVTGNADTATTLATGRNFSITGDVTAGAVSFDGSGNVALSAAIASGVIVNDDINASAAIVDTKLATISTAGKVSNSATTATNANTNSAIVARDGSGNFSAGTITASLSGNATSADSATAAAYAVQSGYTTGNAATATALETARDIGGVSFDGTGNINLPGVNTAGNQNTSGNAATADSATNAGTAVYAGYAGGVTANSVTLGTDTTGNYVQQGATSGNGISGSVNSEGGTFTVTSNATNANTASTIVFRDGSGNFSAGTITASLSGNATSADSATSAGYAVQSGYTTGNAATATALETARNIGGVSFDGTGDINLPGVNTAGNQNTSGTAAVATTVTVTDNEATNENNVILFGAGAAGSGNIGVEADGNMTYNPSTGKITATGFIGALTGDASGNAGTATALETARTIGGVSFDGTANINLPGVNTAGNQNTSGTAAIATAVTVADESTDTTCFPLFATAATGDLEPKSGTNLTFNSSNGTLAATVFSGSGASLTSLTSSNFTSAVTLNIKNSAGSNLKTIVGSAT